jgi:tetratricopeptide (TPR) repeat protein
MSIIPSGLLAWRERRRALRELKALQREDRQRLERDESNLVKQAKLALKIGDPLAALHHWQAALVRYPEFAKKSRDSLDVLLGLERLDEAEALMLEGKEDEPHDSYYAAGYALVAERRGQFEEAIRRWRLVRKKFPGYADAYVHGAICLRRSGQFDAADRLSKKNIRLFPKDIWARIEWATIAERRCDWPEAARRWKVSSERFGDTASDIGVARCLTELGRFEEAEQRLKEVQSRRPRAHEIAIALAQLAIRHNDLLRTLPTCADDANGQFVALRN